MEVLSLGNAKETLFGVASRCRKCPHNIESLLFKHCHAQMCRTISDFIGHINKRGAISYYVVPSHLWGCKRDVLPVVFINERITAQVPIHTYSPSTSVLDRLRVAWDDV